MNRVTTFFVLSAVFGLVSIFSGCGGTNTNNSSGTGAIVGSLSSIAGETANPKVVATATTNAALQGCRVQVEGNDNLSAITDSSGNFMIKNVPPGTYTLIAETPVASGPPLILRKAGVQVLPGAIVALTYVGQTPAGAVCGNVVIPGKSDLSGVFIYVPGPSPCGTYTDKDGSFILTSLAPGKLEIRAQMAGYGEYVYRDVMITSGLATPLGTVTLTKIEGSVKVEGSVNLAGPPPSTKLQAQLFPLAANPGDYNVYLVDVVDGKFSFENVIQGPYTLIIGDHVGSSQSGTPGTSYGAVAEYRGEMMVSTNDIVVPLITLRLGAKVTSLSENSGFNFDNGTFNSGQFGDIYVKDLNYNLSAPLGSPQFSTVYSNGNNLCKVPYQGNMRLASLIQVPTSGFVSSITVSSLDMVVVKTSGGNYAKVLFNGSGYSNGLEQLSFEWQLQPDGALQFDY